jgi:hypothetical protein
MKFIGLRLLAARTWRRYVQRNLDYNEREFQHERQHLLTTLAKATAREADLRHQLARQKGHRTGDELVGIACIAAALLLPTIPDETPAPTNHQAQRADP